MNQWHQADEISMCSQPIQLEETLCVVEVAVGLLVMIHQLVTLLLIGDLRLLVGDLIEDRFCQL